MVSSFCFVLFCGLLIEKYNAQLRSQIKGEEHMTREETRVWRSLEYYIKTRQTFFKEESRPAWKAWKTAELQLVASYIDNIKDKKK